MMNQTQKRSLYCKIRCNAEVWIDEELDARFEKWRCKLDEHKHKSIRDGVGKKIWESVIE